MARHQQGRSQTTPNGANEQLRGWARPSITFFYSLNDALHLRREERASWPVEGMRSNGRNGVLCTAFNQPCVDKWKRMLCGLVCFVPRNILLVMFPIRDYYIDQ